MTWFAVIFSFVFIPTMELFLNTQSNHYDEEDNIFYDLILWIQVPIQYGLLFYFLSIVGLDSYTNFEKFGLMMSMGINCGVIGINVAHELGHRSKTIEIIMAKLLLISSLYYQFYIDHNKGHHKHVSTPEDPASARKGQTVYGFIPKSIVGTFISALKIDRVDMIKGIGYQIILMLIIRLIFGLEETFYFIGAATFGFILLESVNYIEHYGLERKLNPSGRYEKVLPKHSWNSNHLVGRGVLFNLSRHSDHHYMVSKKYQKLQNKGDAPQMPTGYPGMILLSLIPPLWFKVMDKRIPK